MAPIELAPAETTLVGLPAISADGATVALPVITDEGTPAGTETGPDTFSEEDQLCRSYAVRLAPIGHTDGEDVPLAKICGRADGSSLLDAGNRATLETALAALEQRLRTGGYRTLAWAAAKTGKTASTIELAGLTLKVTTAGLSDTRDREDATGLTVSVKASRGKKAVGKASLIGPRNGEFLSTRVTGAALVDGDAPYAYVAATWDGSTTALWTESAGGWIAVRLKR